VKGSDVEKEIARRNGGASVVEIPLGTRLSDANAKKVTANITSYRDTHIPLTEGGAQSLARAYGKDEVLDGFFRRKQMHALLNKMCCDANLSDSEARPLRDALDRQMDEEGPEDEDEEEEEPEESEDELSAAGLHAALDQIIADDLKRRGVVAKDRSIAMDAGRRRKKKICCFDCATLAGLKGARVARRAFYAARARVI
jgi:hypothetical protein